jgi:hypothetical protein
LSGPALAAGADFLYDVLRGGEISMRKVRAVLLAVSLGMALSACSKCDVPVYMPGACRGGPSPGQALAGLGD